MTSSKSDIPQTSASRETTRMPAANETAEMATETPQSDELAGLSPAEKRRLINERSQQPEVEIVFVKTDYRRTTIVLLNLFTLFLFLITACLVCLWPEYSEQLGIANYAGIVLLMLEIAFMLFLGGWQYNFSRRFRTFAFITSGIVACEALIIFLYSC